MKKVISLLMCIVLIGCSKPTVENDFKKFKEEYEQLNAQGIEMDIPEVDLKYVSEEEAVNILKTTGIIYFGFPSCPWCRNIIPVLFEVVNDQMPIYYFDPSDLRSNSSESELMTILDEYLRTNDEGKKVLYVPDVYFIKDGKIIGHHLGSAESQKNPYTPLTNEQKQELKNIYQELLNHLKQG